MCRPMFFLFIRFDCIARTSCTIFIVLITTGDIHSITIMKNSKSQSSVPITATQLAQVLYSVNKSLQQSFTATKYPYECKYSSSNEQFWDTFPWQDFFPDNSLTVNIPDISLTCFKFPDISRFSRQVATPNNNNIDYFYTAVNTAKPLHNFIQFVWWMLNSVEGRMLY